MSPVNSDLQPLSTNYNKTEKKLLDSLGEVYSIHQFAIKYGSTAEKSPEFTTFKRANITRWGAVSLVIHLLEGYMKKYNVPHAVVDGGKILILAEDELTRPDEKDLFACILNQAQVHEFLVDPEKKFKGQNGEHLAAIAL